MPNYPKYTIDGLAEDGDVSLHNVGPDLWVLRFSPQTHLGVRLETPSLLEGRGRTVAEAIANLRPAGPR